MPKLRRRNSDPHSAGSTPLRSSLADAAWAVEDRVVWGAADILRGIADVVMWPFQRIAWAVEHWLVWPIQEETALWSKPVRAVVLAATLLVAAGGVAAGVVVSDPTGGGGDAAVEASAPVATPPVPVAPPIETPAAQDPVLKGAVPDFEPESVGGVPKAEVSAEVAAAAAGAKAATDAKAAPGTSTTSSGDPVVAGPGAIKVAREFSTAFLLYETGRNSPEVRETFRATASPDLVQALLKRPPRLPANVKVPRAKVLNIVAGPRQGDTYTLSVSLLRVGITSELRLDLKKTPVGKGPSTASGAGAPGKAASPQRSQWLVTDVLG